MAKKKEIDAMKLVEKGMYLGLQELKKDFGLDIDIEGLEKYLDKNKLMSLTYQISESNDFKKLDGERKVNYLIGSIKNMFLVKNLLMKKGNDF